MYSMLQLPVAPYVLQPQFWTVKGRTPLEMPERRKNGNCKAQFPVKLNDYDMIMNTCWHDGVAMILKTNHKGVKLAHYGTPGHVQYEVLYMCSACIDVYCTATSMNVQLATK